MRIIANKSILHNNVTGCTFIATELDQQVQSGTRENDSHIEWMGDLTISVQSNTLTPAKTLEQCKDIVTKKTCGIGKWVDFIGSPYWNRFQHNVNDEAAEMYAKQFRSTPTKFITDQEIDRMFREDLKEMKGDLMFAAGYRMAVLRMSELTGKQLYGKAE